MRRARFELLETRRLLSLTVPGGNSYEDLVAAIESSPSIIRMPEFISVDRFDNAGSGESAAKLEGIIPGGYFDISDGDGRFLHTLNANVADTTNSDQLWGGGGLGLDLDGNGYTAGIWDEGWVLTTHQEFGSRVTVKDTGSETLDHATHVAGTLGADGDDSDAHGMANQVNIWSYDWDSAMTELDTAASSIDVSNHSYGKGAGWTYAELPDPDDTEEPYDTKWFGVWMDRRDLVAEDRIFGKYTSDAVDLDEVLHDNPDLLSVWSAGNDIGENWEELDDYWYYAQLFNDNEWYSIPLNHATWPAPDDDGSHDNGYDSVLPQQTAKNALTVGAIQDNTADPHTTIAIGSFSGRGSTDDGRVKPDLVANGTDVHSTVASANDAYDGDQSLGDDTDWDGTSMATPNVSGTAIQLVEHFEDEFSFYPDSATTKGVMLHTAFDAGNTGPDYTYGWGLLDAAEAATFITDAAEVESDYSIFELPYYDLDDDHLTFEVTSDGTDPLNVTMVWTDPAGTANTGGLDDSTAALVNDLNLWITGPSETHYYPWTLNPASPASAAVRTAANHLDNVEQVLIDSPSSGTYTIHVGHTGELQEGLPQDFSLMISEAEVTPEIQITGFQSDALKLEVDYTIIADVANLAEFDIGIYRSADGSSLDAQLMYEAVTNSADRTPGGHSVEFNADFSDPQQDYYLMAKVDSAGDITEGFDDNNQGVFSGGAFLNIASFPYILDVHGTDALNDAVDVLLDGYVKVTLNGVLVGQAPPSYVGEVHVRTHDGDDTVTIGDGMNKALWVFGGDDDDTLEGGGGDDYLDGGAGDDTYVFTGSGDLGEDTIAESSVGGNDPGDTLHFTGLSRLVTIDLSDETSQAVATDLALTLEDGDAIEDVLATVFADQLWGNGRDNFLSGGAGNDSLEGGGGDDSLNGGAGNDTYFFGGSADLGHDTITEASDADTDTFDLTDLGYGVYLDISSTQARQSVAQNLELTLSNGDGIEDIEATAYDDMIWGNERDNEVYAHAGDDTVYGGYGDDDLHGHDGSDVLFGEDDDDELSGGAGDDYLDSGYGLDVLEGGDDDDYLNVVDGEGEDEASGGDGYDIAYGDPAGYGYSGSIDYLDAEETYPGEEEEGDSAAGGGDLWAVGLLETPAEGLIYGGLQDPKTLQRWRETLWFYIQWQQRKTQQELAV